MGWSSAENGQGPIDGELVYLKHRWKRPGEGCGGAFEKCAPRRLTVGDKDRTKLSRLGNREVIGSEDG